jgi:hypothetical protein
MSMPRKDMHVHEIYKKYYGKKAETKNSYPQDVVAEPIKSETVVVKKEVSAPKKEKKVSVKATKKVLTKFHIRRSGILRIGPIHIAAFGFKPLQEFNIENPEPGKLILIGLTTTKSVVKK